MNKPTLLARSAGAAFLTAVLLVGGGVPGALPVSAQASTASFTVSGTVADGQGPVSVVLYLWPSQATTAALKPGQKVPLRVLATQTTSSGSYALSVDPATLGAAMGTIVNMEVVASANGAMHTYSFPRQLVTGPTGRPVLAALSSKPQMAPQAANLHLTSARRQCPNGGAPFALVFKKNLGGKSVIVGALYSRARDVTAIFSYDQSQSSSLGVGLSASTKFAKFSEEGTHSISSSSGLDFPHFHGHTAHLYKSEFRYGKYRWKCAKGVQANVVWGAWQVQGNDYAGGASSPKLTKSPDARFCFKYEAHVTFRKSTTSAYTFTKGVNTSGDIGIDLSTQTG